MSFSLGSRERRCIHHSTDRSIGALAGPLTRVTRDRTRFVDVYIVPRGGIGVTRHDA